MISFQSSTLRRKWKEKQERSVSPPEALRHVEAALDFYTATAVTVSVGLLQPH